MWGTIIVDALLIGGSFAYHKWFEYHPPPPRPADILLPRVDNGAPIPLLYGRCRTRAPIMVFSGNIKLPDDDDHRYKLDITFVVGVPFFGGQASSPIGNAWAGDVKLLAATDSTPQFGEAQVIIIEAGADFTDLFGVGEFYPGSPTQNVGDPLTKTHARMIAAGIDGTQIPGYRSQVVFSFVGNSGPGLSIGLTSQVPAFAFEVISLSTGTRADMGQSLTEEADPAAVIFDLLTSPWAKLGLPEDSIDRPSFVAASLVLFNEGHGYSRAFDQIDTAEAMIGDVLKQIDGAIYQEPTTGKLVLRLARADYIIADLDDINPSNTIELTNYQVQGWNEIPNQVRVTFTQREANYADGLAIGQNEASATAQQGRRRPVDIRYVGCCTRELADKLASRDLAFVGRPQVKATVVVNRSFYQARLLDVFTFTRPELGIDHMVMRVARVDFGQLHDGKITLDLIRDLGDATVGAFPTQG